MQCIKRILSSRTVNYVQNNCKSQFRCVSSKINICNNVRYPMVTALLNQRYTCKYNDNLHVSLYSSTTDDIPMVDEFTFEYVSDQTLESLTDYFEEIIESDDNLKEADVNYSSGVLTISFGKPHGTYVINRQSPNRQIWLSSPTSGPKRYDFMTNSKNWIYKHNGETLHHLLQTEIEKIVKQKVDFKHCLYSNY